MVHKITICTSFKVISGCRGNHLIFMFPRFNKSLKLSQKKEFNSLNDK